VRDFIIAFFTHPFMPFGPASKEYAVQSVLESIKNNPVRLYAIATAALALIAFYAPALPVVLILGLVAAILGVGEGVRSQVTPTRKLDATNMAKAADDSTRFTA
jgi:hypothetical protein